MQLEAGENPRAGRSAKVLERRGSVGTLGNGNAAFRQNRAGRALQMVGEGVGRAKAWQLRWSNLVGAEYSWRAKTAKGES